MVRTLANRLTHPRSVGLFSALVLLPAAWLGCSSGGTQSPGTGGKGGSGTGGAGGAGGNANTCTVPSGSVKSCASPVKPNGTLLTDFSSSSWMDEAGKWGVCGNILGATTVYNGGSAVNEAGVSSLSAKVDTTAANYVISGAILAGNYGGGILTFATCGDLTAYKGLSFTLGGTGTGSCELQFQLQTWSQQEKRYDGGCDPEADGGTSCYQFPKTTLSTTSGPVTVNFADLYGMPEAPADFLKEVIGLQWHLQSSGGDCTDVKLTVDDVKLIAN